MSGPAGPTGVDARVRAAESLGRVLREGAYSNVLSAQAASEMSRADARFSQFLLYTALRQLTSVDSILQRHMSRNLDATEPGLLDQLRIGVVEIVFGSTPDHAAVNVAVDAARRRGLGRGTGFVNGVLRSVARDRDARSSPQRPLDAAPAWIRKRLTDAWDAATADDFLIRSNEEAPLGVRVRVESLPLDGRAVAGIEGAFYVDGPEGVAESVDDGTISIIDPASVYVANAVDVAPGMRVLDAAAAPGGKALAIADALDGTGMLVVADRHERRLVRTASRMRAAGVESPELEHYVAMDAAAPAFGDATFDRVLLDAPCTGLGTLRRRPEIQHRIDPDSPARLGALQRRLLEACLRLLRPDGKLVYSVCTVFPEETVDVVAGHNASPPAGDVGIEWGGGRLLGPHLDGTDGMFVAEIVKRS